MVASADTAAEGEWLRYVYRVVAPYIQGRVVGTYHEVRQPDCTYGGEEEYNLPEASKPPLVDQLLSSSAPRLLRVDCDLYLSVLTQPV
jgi:hypothetical protein